MIKGEGKAMVKRAKISLGVAGLFLSLAANGWAATYYFSTSGNNTTGDGSQANPYNSVCGPWASAGCKTGNSPISSGLVKVNPGDRLLFKRGDEWVGLDATWTINAAGSAGNPITFGAWGDPDAPRPIFRGAKTAFELGKDSWTNVLGTPIWYTSGINVWPNTAAQEETAPGGPSLYGAWSVQGVTNTNGWTLNQSMVRGTYFYDSTTKRLYVWRSDDLKPDHAAGRDIYIGVAPNDGTDRLVKVNRGSAAGGYYVFRDLHAKMSRGYGFSTSYPNTEYINCLSELNSMEGFLFDRRRFGAPLPGAKDGIMRDSVARRNNLKQGTGTGQGVTIEAENVWIYDSESYENAWAGFDFLDYDVNTKASGGIANSKAYHNGIQPVSQANYDPNIYIDGASNVTIRDCEFWGAGEDPRGVKTRLKPNPGISIDVEGLGFSVGKRPTNIKVLNTSSYGNAGPAIRIGEINGRQDAISALSNIQVIGSTLQRLRGDGDIKGFFDPNTVDPGIRVFRFKGVSGGLVFKNNLVLAQNTARAPVFGSKPMIDQGKTVADFDNNIYYCPSCNYNVTGNSKSGGFFSYAYIQNLTLDQWLNVADVPSKQRDTALPKTVVTANPMLIDMTLAGFDAHLQPTSPAIDAANPLAFPVLTPPLSGTTNPTGLEDNPYNDLGYHYPVTGAAPAPAPDTQSPTAPSGLTAVPSGSQVLLSWVASTDNVGVTGYYVFDGAALLGTSLSAGYTFQNAVSGQTYGFSVKAFDAANNVSPPSNTVTLTVGAPSDTTPPTVPTGLTAVLSGTQVSLSWAVSTDDTGVALYEVMNNGSVIGTSISTLFLHNGKADFTYNYTVRAKDAANNVSVSSGIVTVTIPPQSTTGPAAPTNLVADIVNTQVQLSWSASTDGLGYNVYRNNVYWKTVSKLSTYDNNAMAGLTYSYFVKAYDGSNNKSAPSNTVTVTMPGGTVDTTAPSAPLNLTASLTDTTAGLSWAASTDNVQVAGYQVFQDAALLGDTPATSYSAPALRAGQSYTFTVKAYDEANNVSASSNEATVTVPVPPDTTAPSAPLNLTASLTDTTAGLSWAASTDNVQVAGYQVFQDAALLGDTPATSYSAPALRAGQSYTFTVKAYDEANNVSASSNEATVTVPRPGPATPVNLIAYQSGSSVYVGWTSSLDAAGYELQRNGVFLVNVTSPSTTDLAVTAGQTYTYAVRAFDAAGNFSGFSDAMSVTVTEVTGPAAPTNLVADIVNTRVDLSWSASTDGLGYNVYRNNAYLKTVSGLSASDKTAQAGMTYAYFVKAYDGSNNKSTPSNAATVTMPAV